MQQGFRAEAWRLAILWGVALLFGFIKGGLLWWLLAATGGYLAWTFFNLRKLATWLKSGLKGEPPDAGGIWGDLIESIYRLRRSNEKTQQHLMGVIHRVQDTTAALPDGVVLLNNKGDIDWWNPAAETLLGFRKPTDLGQPLLNLLRDPRFVAYLEEGDFKQPLDLPSPQDDQAILQFQITEFGQGERLMIARDVTQYRRLEQMRKDFVANVSHELRTPLTVISGYLETLLDNAEQVPQRWSRALDQMRLQAGRMESLIHDLMLLARLESEPVSRPSQPVNVNKMLQSIQHDAEALAAAKGHRIELDCATDLQLHGDDQELRSAFSNLVINAVKYTPENGRIQVRCWRDSSGGHVAVSDNGIGIDSKHIPRLTERFYRADASRAVNTGGTGLGLAIVKHVLMRHKGKLDIQSRLGAGSTFTCHFPPERVAN